MKPNSPKKEHYAYSKHGSCSILAAIEPKTGQRLAHVRRQRTKQQFTWFMKNLAQNYPNADKIIVVLDNLNTHTPNAFYEVLEAENAEKLANRFEFVYTPKSASWLNIIERGGPSHRIFSSIKAMPQQKNCLNKRTFKTSDALFQTGPPVRNEWIKKLSSTGNSLANLPAKI